MTNTETEFRKVANMLATGLGGLAVGAGAGYALAGGKEEGESDEEYQNRRLTNAGLLALPGAAVGAGLPLLKPLKDKITTGSVDPTIVPGGANAPKPETLWDRVVRGSRQAYVDPFVDAVKGGDGLKERAKDLSEGVAAIAAPAAATPFILAGAGARNNRLAGEAAEKMKSISVGQLSPGALKATKDLSGMAMTYKNMNKWQKIKAMIDAIPGRFENLKTPVAMERAVAARTMIPHGSGSMKGLLGTAAAFGAYPLYNAIMKGPDQGADTTAKAQEIGDAVKAKARELAELASKGNK